MVCIFLKYLITDACIFVLANIKYEGPGYEGPGYNAMWREVTS